MLHKQLRLHLLLATAKAQYVQEEESVFSQSALCDDRQAPILSHIPQQMLQAM